MHPPHRSHQTPPTRAFHSANSTPNLTGIRIGFPSLPASTHLPPTKPHNPPASCPASTTPAPPSSPTSPSPVPKPTKPSPSLPAKSPQDTDLKVAINTYLATLATKPNLIFTLADHLAFTKRCPAEQYPERNAAVL
ncbi:predicted protein [Plenodomus lingam JN3]|uniref:Predicted protein n=1 Tax=Leptosphaeria maculans (strain JN3 / isolate v23.1.3 / race Av1-4-5-6-7-8) TaxID=985895 RepID=E5R589_LEPMJ|nr:predicted protein [Plenodomus lingam JN3]CBX92059.1 predicted protein [Plenodomus lingam JN3]